MFIKICFLFLLVSATDAFTTSEGNIFLIRHGEKNNKAKSGDVHLNPRGTIRAGALALFFFPLYSTSKPIISNTEFPAFKSVVAQAATDRYPSRRKIETAQPIATAGNIPLRLFDHEDIDGTSEYLLAESRAGRTTLVVWDHTTISDLANQLLRLPQDTVHWPMDRYDVIWEVDVRGGTLRQYCQQLLFGDLWCPVNPIQVYPVTNSFRRYMNGEKGIAPVMS